MVGGGWERHLAWYCANAKGDNKGNRKTEKVDGLGVGVREDVEAGRLGA